MKASIARTGIVRDKILTTCERRLNVGEKPPWLGSTLISGVSHINILVKNYQKAIAFYTNQLGLKLIVNDPSIDHYEVAAEGSGGPGICLCEDGKMVGEHTGIIFATRDIKATCQTLKKNGVRITEPYQAHGEWWAGLKDLDGNSYGLHQVQP